MERRLATRRANVAAVAALVVLNMLDIVTTRLFVHAGVDERNPLAGALGPTGIVVLIVKGALVAAIAWRLVRAHDREPTSPWYAGLLWALVGWYVCATYTNVVALRHLA